MNKAVVFKWFRRLVIWPAVAILLLLAGAIAGVMIDDGRAEKNDKPRYGGGGLPTNCRAMVQANINGYRSNQYTADEIVASLERNCGAAGYLW